MVESEDKYDSNETDMLERELRAALRPLLAPEGFTNRVLARAQGSPESESVAFRSRNRLRPQLRWFVAAVLLLTVGLGALWNHQRQRRMAGERARDQVLLALRITSSTIRAVRNRVTADSNTNGQQQETP